MNLQQLQRLLDMYNEYTGHSAHIAMYGRAEDGPKLHLDYHNGIYMEFETPGDLINFLSEALLVEE